MHLYNSDRFLTVPFLIQTFHLEMKLPTALNMPIDLF
ncbi:hypothetical protein CoNPh26_CDS0138 [Staphylococcus phage S-CoN_Ph26]|nr:hypothetical protein CoNPh26_CDS0138 [Staphylococcus phage S-CoN_Ph26]